MTETERTGEIGSPLPTSPPPPDPVGPCAQRVVLISDSLHPGQLPFGLVSVLGKRASHSLGLSVFSPFGFPCQPRGQLCPNSRATRSTGSALRHMRALGGQAGREVSNIWAKWKRGFLLAGDIYWGSCGCQTICQRILATKQKPTFPGTGGHFTCLTPMLQGQPRFAASATDTVTAKSGGPTPPRPRWFCAGWFRLLVLSNIPWWDHAMLQAAWEAFDWRLLCLGEVDDDDDDEEVVRRGSRRTKMP